MSDKSVLDYVVEGVVNAGLAPVHLTIAATEAILEGEISDDTSEAACKSLAGLGLKD